MSIASEYNEIIRGHKSDQVTQHHSEEPSSDFNRIPPGMNFKLLALSDGIPFIKCSCSDCKMIVTTESVKAVFKHCGVEYPIPQELLDRLEAQQIKRGIRRKPTVIQRIKGETPALAPRLNNF